MAEDGRTEVALVEATESRKRERENSSSGSESLGRVAEIVMILSAMGQMRAGRDPTAVERALMAEARDKLARFCESMDVSCRKNLFTKEMAMALVVDHGLNPPRDNVPRPPKLSIAEKIIVTKKKMEEAREMTAQSSGQPPQSMPVSFGVKAESRPSIPPGAQKIIPDKPVSQLPEKLLIPSAPGVIVSTSATAQDAKFQAAPIPGNQHLMFQFPPGTIFYDQSSVNSHHDIIRMVQRVLPPKPIEQLNWVPPPTDYTNRPIPCQICKATINDVESVLVCDACEKGVHMKCLPSFSQRIVPKGEWHCPLCLASSHGKPLPPKYGRVTRTVTASRPLPSADRKGNPESDVHGEPSSSQVSSDGGNGGESADERKKGSEKDSDDFFGSEGKRAGSISKQLMNSILLPCQRHGNASDLTHLSVHPPAREPINNPVTSTIKILDREKSTCNEKDEIREINREIFERDCKGFPQWIGEPVEVFEDRSCYHSCSLKGVVYKLEDHVLISSSDGNVFPSKLQALWEEKSTGAKWAQVLPFYFPSNLPEKVPVPAIPESNEVYSTNIASTVRVDSISGICHVKAQKSDEDDSTARSSPIYFSRWFYDATKAVFQPLHP